jgi:hypothetical protein
MVKQIYLIFLGLIVVSISLQAEIFQSVDENGNVVFTDSPPADAINYEKVEIAPAPSQESISDTMERNKAIRKALDEAQEKRLEKQTTKQARLDKAIKDVEEAKKRVTEAEKIGEDDRQGLQGGKSIIRPEYFENLKKTQQELEAAKKRLKEIRGY